LFINLITFYHYCVAALSTAFIIIIDDVTLSADYNYSSTENVLSTVNELKMTAEILYY